jgi:hypothetical protein
VEDTDTGDVLLPLYVVWFDKRFGDERLRTERYGGQAVLRSTTKRSSAGNLARRSSRAGGDDHWQGRPPAATTTGGDDHWLVPSGHRLCRLRKKQSRRSPPSENPLTYGDSKCLGSIYMRSILETNYSRKLATLKYREVNIPEDNELRSKQGLLHWHWAFECPSSVKLMVKAHLNEAKAQGHMRLVLLPIVYNAMGDKAKLRSHPLFVAMDREIRRTNYWPLIYHPPSEVEIAQSDAGDHQGPVRVIRNS